MGTLDIILLICFIPAVISGIMRGFVRQVVAVAALVIGAILAVRFSGVISEWLAQYLQMEMSLIRIISFLIIVVVAVLLLNLVGRLLEKVVKISMLGWLDKILGVVVALFLTAMILGILIISFESLNSQWEIVKPEVTESSPVYSLIKNFATQVIPGLKKLIIHDA